MPELEELTAISPIDGRYRDKVGELADFFSEEALIRYRTKVEIEYLLSLSKHSIIRPIEKDETELLRNLYLNYQIDSPKRVKEIEKTIHHDVNSLVYFIREKLKGTTLEDITENVHIALTSEDINNLSYSLMLKDAINNIYIPNLLTLESKLLEIAENNKSIPMLARTHGQPASPTTVGKEIVNFAHRLYKEINTLKGLKLEGKLNGATGNYNAHVIAYPNFDWIGFSEEFVENLDLKPNLITTQIEPHDSFAALFNNLIRINNIIQDLNLDMWRYISDNYFIQKPKKEEHGSSTMPQKVNPIDFENSEGNIGMANALFYHFSDKLTKSRLQRDLSDSTVQRNHGVALAHSLLAIKSTLKGLGKVKVNYKHINEELINNPQLLAEPIQIILRREGVEGAYEMLKELTRGKKITLEDITTFVSKLNISDKIKEEILKVTTENYIGNAVKLTEIAIGECKGIFPKSL